MKAMVENIPGMSSIIDTADKLVQAFSNRKHLLKDLESFQTSIGMKPLKLLAFSNTRKWSSSFLVISRILRLRLVLELIFDKYKGNDDIPLVNFAALKDVKTLLWPIYYHEMVLQRDSASIVHLAKAIQVIRRSISDMSINLSTAGFVQASEQLAHKLKERVDLVKSCGVSVLALALWPTPKLTNDECIEANKELLWLINKQFGIWQQHASSLCLPDEYVIGDKANEFFLAAVADLAKHANKTEELMKFAADSFTEKCNRLEHEYEHGEKVPLPNRGKQTPDDGIVNLYWLQVCACVPSLYFVYRMLSSCAATEAASERMFSAEAIVHSSERNRLNPEVTAHLVKIRRNFEVLVSKTPQQPTVDVDDEVVEVQ
jgi:hypothetical protein